jgi:hypothetical protein
MSADHNRLDALRRLAKDRAATPAEKATARRLAKALAAKIGKRPRRSRRKGHDLALPEPPAARWRRLWVLWLEAALHKIALAERWVHWIRMVSLACMVLIVVLGGEAVRQQTSEVYIVQILGLVGVALLLVATTALLTFGLWWLKTWRNERLRPALVFLTRHVPWFEVAALALAANVYLERHLKWPMLFAFAAAMVAMYVIGIPWWRWLYPPIERAILRASRGTLRAGVAALAIALIIPAAGGVWAYWPRPVTPVAEFDVPPPFTYRAYLTMINYRLAAWECLASRDSIERDVARLPECGGNSAVARSKDKARQERCQRLRVDLELATTCGRPDIAALADRLRDGVRPETTDSRHRQHRGEPRQSGTR